MDPMLMGPPWGHGVAGWGWALMALAAWAVLVVGFVTVIRWLRGLAGREDPALRSLRRRHARPGPARRGALEHPAGVRRG